MHAQPAVFGTALEIAQSVRSGERSATDVVEEHLGRVVAAEADIHAFNLVLDDQARAAAAAIDARVAAGEDVGPLAGVPIALKDNMCTRGIPTTCSSKILEGWHPPYSATVVERLEAADAIIIGKTNLDEFAMGSSTENSAFGPTLNPHDTTRVPGGSSGGSAAAVAAGFAPLVLWLRHGRLDPPACLVVRSGRRETDLRICLTVWTDRVRQQPRPDRAVRHDGGRRSAQLRGHCGPRSSRHDIGRCPRVGGPIQAAVGVEGLRVGLVTEMLGGVIEGISPDVLARVQVAAEALTHAGATVGEVSLPSSIYGLSSYYIVAPAEASSNLARFDGVRYGLREDGPNTALMNQATRTAGFGDEVKRRIMLGRTRCPQGMATPTTARPNRFAR